jgi:hypothetical protein
MNYVDALVRRLTDLLDEGSDIAEDLQAASHSSLSKKDASRLIDTLIRTLDRLGQPQDNVTPLRPKDEKKKELTPYQIMQREADVFYEAQKTQFGESRERPVPEGSGKYIKVWKKKPNSLSVRYGKTEIFYGWAWECTHPVHRTKVVGGPVKGGQSACIESVGRHIAKYHAGSGYDS